MECPRCQMVELNVQTRGAGADTFEIDVCPKCSGTWLDQMELTELDDNFFVDMEEIPYQETSPTDTDKQLFCPRCEESPSLTKCHPKDYEKVVVDTCPTCHGFWLDNGELEKLRDVSDRLLIASLLDDD